MNKLRVLAGSVIVLCVFCADLHRDWRRFPAVVQLEATSDIYACGDVHGDLERFKKVLTAAGIVKDSKWAVGGATLVLTGDLIDKGPDSLGVIRFVRGLQSEALEGGGHVVALMGNHEAEFLASPSAHKSTEFTEELIRAGLTPKDVAQCSGGTGEFLCGLPMGAKINDWFFSHAGNSGGRSIPQLSAAIERGVDTNGFGTDELANENSLLLARFGEKGPGGRSWIDADAPKMSADRLLSTCADALGAHHIVEGHHHLSVHFEDGDRRKAGAMFQWHGKLFLIDTGMSREIDDSGGAILHIKVASPQAATVICPDGSSTVIWDERKPSNSGGAHPCVR